jgi:hypothetical protein
LPVLFQVQCRFYNNLIPIFSFFSLKKTKQKKPFKSVMRKKLAQIRLYKNLKHILSNFESSQGLPKQEGFQI